MSRPERFPSFLHPESFKIEDRSFEALLEGTIKLSRLINYYNDANGIDGNWEDFFNSDIDVLVRLLSRSRLKTLIRRFESILGRLQNVHEPEEAVAVWNEAFLLLYRMIAVLQKYRTKLTLPENLNGRTASMISITNSLDDEFEKFVAGYNEFNKRFEGIVALDFEKLNIRPAPAVEAKNESPVFNQDETDGAHPGLARSWFNNLFADLRLKFSNLIAAADHYWQHTQWEGNVYQPHLGLFVTFLHLYRDLQDELNKLTGRHLNYYYHDVIGMHHRKPTPDRMYLLFRTAPAKRQLLLPPGETVLAEVPETKQMIEYALPQEVMVTQAEIKEIKTGFISQTQQFSSKNGSYGQVEELRMYTADQPVLQPQQYKDQKANLRPWALFGEEQRELPLSRRTMEDATLGLLIGSPLLYAPDGKRIFKIKFHLTASSFQRFQDYILNFAEVTGYAAANLAAALLNDSLLIRITAANGWYPVKKYNLRLSSGPAEKYIELNVALDRNDVATAVYRPGVHGASYGLTTPALELTLNNNLFHHPFSFCKDFALERIGIQTSVTGSRQSGLQNSLGTVSPSASFQLFGPLPVAGSYLDIKSTNVFNRYTKACTVHIEWFDLPREPGGFETYFNGYDTAIRNDSYTVSVAALSENRPVTPPPLRQRFLLFDTVRSDTSQLFLKDDTTLSNIDCGRLLFKNDLLLNNEGEQNPDTIKGGSIRIELATPDDGFGHRTYPQILPGIVAHNTKKPGHKSRIPNPPYIPVAKSVAVDYVLEHTETLRNNGMEEDAFTLLHLYPYGYKQIYPGGDTTNVHFVPFIEQESNLLIGLQNAEPGSDLSFLFELEETTYHHTAHAVEPVGWYYLQNNTWTAVRADDILYDNTNHFCNSGLVTIRLGNSIATGNTILNPDLYWLKASSAGSKTAGSRVIALFAQAGIAVRKAGTASSDDHAPLPPDSVKGFKQKIPEITAVWQLFPSRGGGVKETGRSYRLRVSERLRHKDGPRTALDFAQLILDAFPQIQTVKCLRKESMGNLMLPGKNVQIVVIPKQREGHPVTDLPRVSLAALLGIKKFVNTKLSAFADAEVGNAVYEEIKIVCTIGVRKSELNSNNGYYLNLFNSDVQRFLAPWLFTETETVKIGGKVYLSDLLDFIRSRPYVSYVSGFSVLHFYRKYNPLNSTWEATLTDSSKNGGSYMEASRPDAVLISSDNHLITIVDDPAYRPPVVSGIGDLVIGKELHLADPASSSAAAEVPEPADDEDGLFFHF